MPATSAEAFATDLNHRFSLLSATKATSRPWFPIQPLDTSYSCRILPSNRFETSGMTAVASPPSFHPPGPRTSWTNGANSNSLSMHAQMTSEEVSRLLMPPRSKSSSRPTSSSSTNSSVSSASSTISASSTGSTPASSNPSPNNSEPNTPVTNNNANHNNTNGSGGGNPWPKKKAARNGVGSRETSMRNSGNASSALNAALASGIGGNGTLIYYVPEYAPATSNMDKYRHGIIFDAITAQRHIRAKSNTSTILP